MAKIPIKSKDDDSAPENADSEASGFDAVAAANELAASLGEGDATTHNPGTDPYTQSLEEEITTVNRLLTERDQSVVEANTRADHAFDEIEKTKARLERAAAQELEQRARKLLVGFLDVLDDLDRAIAAARDMDHNPDVLSGIDLVRRSFMRKLGDHGVTHVPAAGERFNPDLHDAVAAVPVAKKTQDGVVVAVMQEGYAIGDDVLRPAKVAVGKKS